MTTAKESRDEKGRQYFSVPPRWQEPQKEAQIRPPYRISPPYGKKRPKAFTCCLGIELLTLGGAPEPTLKWTKGRALIGCNLGVNLEMWLLNYAETADWAELSVQFAETPAFLTLRESEEDEREPWLQGRPWDHERRPLNNTFGGLYLLIWPSSWKDYRSGEVYGNPPLTAIYDGEKYSLGVFIAGFEYLLSELRLGVSYEDGNGHRFVGLSWEFKDDEGRLIAVTVRQDELSQKVPAMKVQESPGANTA